MMVEFPSFSDINILACRAGLETARPCSLPPPLYLDGMIYSYISHLYSFHIFITNSCNLLNALTDLKNDLRSEREFYYRPDQSDYRHKMSDSNVLLSFKRVIYFSNYILKA